jgi:tRNA nucleotidyltransferase (CCA-adding enzyme)
MPDYMFLLESRLSAEQRAALVRVQELAIATGTNVYLTGGAVRDLISGMPIRDLDFTVEGNSARLARELEKSGARVTAEDEHLRHVELIFPGDQDGSIAAARDDVYARPGTRPEIRWATIMEDLRRRDFSMNAIAISLNPASRGLLLDPTNGLADLEKQEVRALSIHSFTNQPVRLMRLVRFCARMGFKMESRTSDWFSLALDRELHKAIPPEDVGAELRQLAREDKPIAILKAWEDHDLVAAIHPQLARRHPHYDAIQRLVRVREDMNAAGLRPRLLIPAIRAFLGRLKSRECAAALSRMEFRSADVHAVLHLETEAKKTVKLLSGRKTAAPRDAFNFLDKTPLDMLAYILAEFSNAKARGKIKNYLFKWRSLRQELPAAVTELEALGMPRGPKFDQVIEKFFDQQLLGKGKTQEERTKLLRKISGIKEPPKKKVKEEKKRAAPKSAKAKSPKGELQPGGAEAPGAAESAAKHPHGAPPAGKHAEQAARLAASRVKGAAAAPAKPAHEKHAPPKRAAKTPAKTSNRVHKPAHRPSKPTKRSRTKSPKHR